MDQNKLNEMIVRMETPLKDETLADSITAISATLAHVLILSIQQNAFEKRKLHEFFDELETRIVIETKPKGIKRAD